jgi:hypothetical protein
MLVASPVKIQKCEIERSIEFRYRHILILGQDDPLPFFLEVTF